MHSECVSAALVIEHAQRMCHIMLSSAACPAVQYFSIFGKNFVSSFLFSATFYATFLILRRIWRDAIVCTKIFMYRTRYYYQTLIKLEFSLQISGNYSNVKFLENPNSGSRVIACRETEMTKRIIIFRNFPKSA